jgi:hypothetical protein
MKLIMVIKMCLNETYSKVRIGKHLSDKFSYPKWSKTRRFFIATDFKLCFRKYHQECPGKPGGTETKWDTSASGLC